MSEQISVVEEHSDNFIDRNSENQTQLLEPKNYVFLETGIRFFEENGWYIVLLTLSFAWILSKLLPLVGKGNNSLEIEAEYEHEKRDEMEKLRGRQQQLQEEISHQEHERKAKKKAELAKKKSVDLERKIAHEFTKGQSQKGQKVGSEGTDVLSIRQRQQQDQEKAAQKAKENKLQQEILQQQIERQKNIDKIEDLDKKLATCFTKGQTDKGYRLGS